MLNCVAGTPSATTRQLVLQVWESYVGFRNGRLIGRIELDRGALPTSRESSHSSPEQYPAGVASNSFPLAI